MARDTKKIDKKGRFFVPTKIREKLGDEYVVTNGLDDGYLGVYQKDYFYSVIVPQFDELNTFDARIRKIKRLVIGEREDVVVDSQGRINIPQELWDNIEANPEDDICIFEESRKFDICTKARYMGENNSLSQLAAEADIFIKGM